MLLSERRKEGPFYIVVQHGASEIIGGEVEIKIFCDNEGEGSLLLRRSLYFEEQNGEHIDNFCKAFAFDQHYRAICLDGSAHWHRVARLYEANAMVIRDESVDTPEEAGKCCRELFHCLRRDLILIESRPEYQEEMKRVESGEEEDLRETLALFAQIKEVKITSACQGAAPLLLDNREIVLPPCHFLKTTITMRAFPQALKKHLLSGPIGQHHLAKFEENTLSTISARRNKQFIRALTTSLKGFVHKRAGKRSR